MRGRTGVAAAALAVALLVVSVAAADPPTEAPSITGGPDHGSVTSATSANFTFTSSDPAATGFACSLDAGGFAACSSPQGYSGLGDGPHTFAVQATNEDGAGPAASRSWSVDTTAPPVPTLSGPPSPTADNTPTFTFSSAGAASFQCSVDGPNPPTAPCASPFTTAPLSDGQHVFRVRALDALGNASAPASETIVVDTTAPVLTVPADRTIEANGPAGSSATYTVTASDGGVALLPGAISCKPASGSTFPLGKTTVECSATDAVGNTASKSFAIAVADRTPPTINAPDVTVTATSASGIERSSRALSAYLAGVQASDLVSSVSVTNDAPERFPVGTTTVTFTARDAAGNTATKAAKVVVLPPGRAATPPDLTPPADVAAAKAVPRDHAVALSWKLPPRDVAYVVVRRSIQGQPRTEVQAFRGLASSFVDRKLRNGTEYRYLLIVFDRAGNRSKGVVLLGTPKAQLLAQPKPGARLSKPPLMRWAPVPAATYFNVQLWLKTKKGAVKVLSAWPAGARYRLPRSWMYEGKRRQLVAGSYVWYVWPGLGDRAEVRYGELLGQSSFTFVVPKKAALKPPATRT